MSQLNFRFFGNRIVDKWSFNITISDNRDQIGHYSSKEHQEYFIRDYTIVIISKGFNKFQNEKMNDIKTEGNEPYST